jgi:predicted nuclease of restriction endonuclease-like (RecB) superfamily
LIEKLKDPTERLWYAKKTIEHGWSRSILDHQIDSGLYRRQGKASTNFARTLPPPQSDLAVRTAPAAARKLAIETSVDL